MRQSKQVVKIYETLIDELGPMTPGEKWKVQRRLANNMLRLFELQVEYENARAKHGGESGDVSLTTMDRKNIKEAIELRRTIYRMMKEIKEHGTLSAWQ